MRFTYDINGILEVEATSLTTGRTISTVLVGQGSGLTEEQARRRLKELEGLKIHPRDQQENRLLLAKGERLWQEALGEERQIIGQAVQLFGEALASQENGRILRARARIKDLLDRLEAGLSLEGLDFSGFDDPDDEPDEDEDETL